MFRAIYEKIQWTLKRKAELVPNHTPSISMMRLSVPEIGGDARMQPQMYPTVTRGGTFMVSKLNADHESA